MIDEIIDDAKNRMEKSIDSLKRDFGKVRTGRATTALVEHITADYYGTETPLPQMTSISIPEPRTILIQPWDSKLISAVEKGIMKSDLDITPINDGKVIRLTLPDLTKERRREYVKRVGKVAEEHRITTRQVRKDANQMLKDLEKESEISEDELHRLLSTIQDLTDSGIVKINKLLDEKEKEIMEI